MNRFDVYFKQPVSQTEFNGVFDAAEAAIWNQVKDLGGYGIITGFTPSAPGGWNLEFGAGLGLDKNGARLRSAGSIRASVLTDTAGVSTAPTTGSRRWVSIFARFGRSLSDPRTDGNGTPIKFSHAEALNPDDARANVGKLLIVQGAESLVSGPLPPKPTLHASAILLADVLLTDGDAALVMGAVSTARAERFARPSGWSLPSSAERETTLDANAFQYALILDSPAAKVPGQDIRSRVYGSTNGLCITTNAKWDPVVQTWSADYTAYPATCFRLRFDRMSLVKRTNTAVTWLDTDAAAGGWDGQVEFSMPNANSLLSMDADSDIVSKGTQTVYWSVLAHGAPAAHVVGRQVQFPKKFAATPSSVTFSTVGMAADVALPGTGWTFSFSAPRVHRHGAMIRAEWSGGSLTGDDISVERNVIAAY